MGTTTTSNSNSTGAEGLRSHVHAMWAAVAPRWGENADYVDARGASMTETMLASVAPRPGERVLELACGPGGLGLAAAERVAPGGEVVLSDVAAEMTSIAAARADALGLANVGTCVLDFEQIDQPDESFDVVLCREGLMFAFDPAHAAREIGRVLRTDGRVALSVWGPPESNPWLAVVFEVVSTVVGMPMPPPGIPGPFSLGDSRVLAHLLYGAGFDDVAVIDLSTPLHAGSFDEWWTRTSSLAGPLAHIVASLPEDSERVLRARLHEAVVAYQMPTGLEFPGVTLLATARRR